jgi:hypothetical protein
MISTDERQTLAARTADPLDAYADWAAGGQVKRLARTAYAETQPALYRPEDVLNAAMDQQVTVRSAARAERHKARTQTAIKRALFALVGLALAIAAGVGTLSFLVSESSHVPAVVRLVPERAACAMVFVRKC